MMNACVAVPGATALLLALLASGPAWSRERHALIVGANLGWAEDRPLRHAESDAERLRDVLVELGGFASDRVHLLLDPDTQTVHNHLRQLGSALRGKGSGSLLFFYFVGHTDAEYLHLRGPLLSHQELAALLRESEGTFRIGVSDSCRFDSPLPAKPHTPEVSFETQVLDEWETQGLALVTATGADELSQEHRTLQGSLFTHHFISALRGAADANEDGTVTLAEAFTHASQHTLAETGTALGPPLPSFGQEIELSQLSRAPSLLLLPRASETRYLIVDRQEWHLAAEATSSPERQVRVALPPGEYHLKHLEEERLELAPVRLEPGDRVEVAALRFEPRPFASRWLQGQPSLGTQEQLRAWRRTEALRLLAEGEAHAALRLFDRLLKEAPEDGAAQRGRGRSLLRLAEAYARAGNTPQERKALKAALASDPSLREDRSFQRKYGAMQVLEDVQHSEQEARAMAVQEQLKTPVVGRNWGLGFDLISAQGFLVFSGHRFLRPGVAAYLAFDPISRALLSGVQWTPPMKNWSVSPLLRWGVRYSLREALQSLGMDYRLLTNAENEDSLDTLSPWGTQVDAGLLAMSVSGISLRLGVGVLLYGTHDGKYHLAPVPLLGGQWNF